ncbi:MAG: diguanylate cyclase [Lachnospiraceae bacterium]|jgi:diguanylate cyclase (GGDEF)-like protein/PAS domain S-box-containing protein|nr:diguanylate cyclase [Lachnospiraceae bacterium]MCI9397704.1 diguanylate cyclase [Lachnospiraceae bacterium]
MAIDLSIENFGSMIDNIIAGICFFEYEDGEMKPIFVNEGFFRMLGYSRVEGMKYLERVELSIIPDDLPTYRQAIRDVLKDDGVVDTEFRTVTGSGNLRWLHVRGNLYAREGRKYTIVSVIEDITERKSVEEELQRQAERLHILSQAEGEKIIDYNAKTDVMIIRTNDEYGMAQDEIHSRYMQRFNAAMIYKEDVAYYKAVLESLLKSPKHDTIEFRIKRFDEDYTWYQANLTSLLGAEGYVTRIVGRMINIDDRKKKEMELLLRAEKDALTGIYNQGATEQLIHNAIEDGNENSLSAMMIIDLDNFKEANDLLGHANGDQLLEKTAGILKEMFKGGDVIGRIGGDEFLVYMRNLESISDADEMAGNIVKQVRYDLDFEGQPIHVTCSVGVAVYPYHGKNYEELFEKADRAVYTVKANGKDGYRVYHAASTTVYHANRKVGYDMTKTIDYDRHIEDQVMQILFEDKMLESALRSSLELMTAKYQFHRGYICGNDSLPISRTIQFTVKKYATGKEAEEHYELKRMVNEILYSFFPGVAMIHDYDLTAEEMREYFRAEGIKSMLYYPLTSQGEFQGAIVFENHEDVQMELSKSEMEEVRSLFRLMEAHILQIGLMDRLQNFVAQVAIFDNMDSFVYVINPDNYEISFINKKVLSDSPNVKIGDICYKALQNRDTPCENCILRNLDKKDPHCRCTEEMFNYSLRSWTRSSASWLECREENGLALINSFDISEYFMG